MILLSTAPVRAGRFVLFLAGSGLAFVLPFCVVCSCSWAGLERTN